ncbi:MAG: hypothetical protein NTY19_31380 [Planctomycetota bacterium]|nr:hypothetical protein [Planctomycetota bacterium]
MKTVHFSLLATLLLAALTDLSAAELKLASVFADRMVLQRDQPVSVWGSAASNEQVTVEFAGQQKRAAADAQGNWLVKLDPLPRQCGAARSRSLIRQSEIRNPKSKINGRPHGRRLGVRGRTACGQPPREPAAQRGGG